jgi:hypothetical protein
MPGMALKPLYMATVSNPSAQLFRLASGNTQLFVDPGPPLPILAYSFVLVFQYFISYLMLYWLTIFEGGGINVQAYSIRIST